MARIDLGIDKKTGEQAWAEIGDPEDLPQTDRKKIRALLPVTYTGAGEPNVAFTMETVDDIDAAVIASAIAAWWQTDVPVTVETVEALPSRMYDKLLPAVEEHKKIVNFRPGSETSSE